MSTRPGAMQRRRSRRVRFALHPAQAVVVGFATAIVIGALVLVLPISTSSGEWADPVDALFTATSAVCVTGLTVVDTATFWSPFGQVVILALIQLGGLGIMIFASLIGLALARRLSVRSRMNAATEAKLAAGNSRQRCGHSGPLPRCQRDATATRRGVPGAGRDECRRADRLTPPSQRGIPVTSSNPASWLIAAGS